MTEDPVWRESRVSGRGTDLGELLFLLLVAILPIMRPIYLDFRGYQLPPADFIFLAVAAATARSVLTGRKRLPRTDVLLALLSYAAALTISAAASPDRARSFIKLSGGFYLIGLAILGMIHVDSIAALRSATNAWLVGTTITVMAALGGLLMFAAGIVSPYANLFLSIHGSLPEGDYPRVMALFFNPNMLCAYLVASLSLLLAARRVGWVGRVPSAILIAGIALAGIFSLSPGLGGMLLVAVFWIWADRKRRRSALSKAIVGMSVIGAVFFLVAITVSPVPGEPLTFRASSRALTWMAAVGTFRAHPWVGVGMGLDPVHVEYVNPSGILEVLTDAHNAWLSIAAQTGLLGLGSFVLFVAVLLRGTLDFSPDGVGSTLRTGLAVAFLCGFLYQSLSGSFEDTRHVWVLAGLLAAVKPLVERAEQA
jgi:O-antigen ligase